MLFRSGPFIRGIQITYPSVAMTTNKSAYISIIYFLGQWHAASSRKLRLTFILGLSILSHFISRRSITETSSWKAFKRNITSWPRLCVLLIFIDSWAFLFASNGFPDPIGFKSLFISFCRRFPHVGYWVGGESSGVFCRHLYVHMLYVCQLFLIHRTITKDI